MNIEFETPRILLRPFRLTDVEAFYHLNNDPDVNKYLPGEERNISRAEVEQLIKKNTFMDYEKYGFGRMVMVLKSNNQAIGFTGLKYLPELDEVDIGYRIAKQHWGQGLVVEASIPIISYGFNQLDLKRIIALALPENKASIRVMEKLKFTYVKHMELDGEEIVYYQRQRQASDLIE